MIDANQVASAPAGGPRFTSGVWQEEILDYQIDKGMRVHRFSYPAGEHSHWHTHEGEQAIYVESGGGWIKMEGEEGVEVAPGDLVYVPKDKKQRKKPTRVSSADHRLQRDSVNQQGFRPGSK